MMLLDRRARRVRQGSQPGRLVEVGRCLHRPAPEEGHPPVALGEHGKAEPGHAGVDTEHTRIEHLFAGV